MKRLRTDGGSRSNPRPAIAFGLAVILFGLGGFCAWASLAELSSAIIAHGTVKVLSSRKTVQTRNGGIVQEIAVHDGDRVTAGDVLVRLDDTQARAARAVIESSYALAWATVVRLRAELRQTDDLAYPMDLLVLGDGKSIAEILTGQRQLFNSRREALNGQIALVREKIGRLEQEITGFAAQVEAKARQIDIVEREHADLVHLLDQGLTQRSRVFALEREEARLRGDTAELEAAITRTRRQIAEAELETLQLTIDFQQKASDELGNKEAEMLGLAERLAAAQQTLDETVLRATETGTVVELAVHTLGAVLQPGATLLQIVPSQDTLIVEVRINTADIDSVFVGRSAEIVLSAFPRDEVPRLGGEVTYVAADSVADPNNGVPYYVARLTVGADAQTHLYREILVPGMPAEVFISLGERSPLAYLVEPLRDSLARAWREP